MIEQVINVYRYGHYVCSLPNKRAVVRKWIMDNVPFSSTLRTFIPEDYTYTQCLEIANAMHYAFRKVGKDKETNLRDDLAFMYRYTKALENASPCKVAERYTRLKSVGKCFVGDCPVCGAEGELIIHNETMSIRCGGCEKSWNPIQFVMEIEECSQAQAIGIIETI